MEFLGNASRFDKFFLTFAQNNRLYEESASCFIGLLDDHHSLR